MMPGAIGDPPLSSRLTELMADNLRHNLTPSHASKEILESIVTSSLSGAMFPEPIRTAYLSAVAAELDRKLRDELTQQSGWDVAGLYAIGALGETLLKGKADLVFAADQITRALESAKDIKIPPLATLVAQGAQYGSLVASHQLEPEKVGLGAGFGAGRKAARIRLQQSLRSMAPAGEQAPEHALEALTALMDGTIATAVLSSIESRSEPKPDDACVEPDKKSPRVQANWRTLTPIRDRLVADPALVAGKTTWARRARLLAVVLSDILDQSTAGEGKTPVFRIGAQQAAAFLKDGLLEWSSPELAEGIAALHAGDGAADAHRPSTHGTRRGFYQVLENAYMLMLRFALRHR